MTKAADADNPRPLSEDMADALREVRSVVAEERLQSTEVQSLFDRVGELAGAAATYDRLRERLTQLRQDIALKRSLIDDIARRADRLAERQARSDRYTAAALAATGQRLTGLLAQSDDERFLAEWLACFAQAIVDARLDACKRLVEIPFPAPLSPFATLFRTGTEALETNNFAQATGMLTRLANYRLGPVTADPPEVVRALLHVFLSRIHLAQNEREKAQAEVHAALALAPKDGRTLAAQGYVELASAESGDEQDAERLFLQATEVSPNLPDGYRGMGRLSESRRMWPDAERWYAQSLDAAGTAAEALSSLTRLLTPTTGLLYSTLAERLLLVGRPDLALEAVAHALQAGVPAAAESSQRDPFFLKARILETPMAPGAAADPQDTPARAYLESGKRRYWASDFVTARQRFERAIELNPEEAPAYWYLADTLRMLAVLPAFPFTDASVLNEALRIWHAGEPAGHPNTPDDSWAYIVRARIAGGFAWIDARRDEHFWEAAAYLECAAVYARDEIRLTEIARAYRSLVDTVALAATDRAIQIAGGKPGEETQATRASVLINLGQYGPAKQILDDLIAQRSPKGATPAPEAGEYYAWRALIYLARREFRHGLEELERYTDPYPWTRKLRGDLLRFSGRLKEARTDFEWIWARRDDASMPDEFVAWSAYHLGLADAALERSTRLTGDRRTRSDALLLCSLANLALGRHGDALQRLTEAVAAARTRLEITSIDLELERVGREWQSPEWEGAYRELTAAIDARRDALEPGAHSALDELRGLAADQHATAGTWPWIAVHATLGRLLLEAGFSAAAVDEYAALQAFPDRFPAAGFAVAMAQARHLETKTRANA